MLRDSPNNHSATQSQRGTDLPKSVLFLKRQFSCWHQNQALPFELGNALDHRYPKSQGLSRSGLGDPNDVFSLQSAGNHLMLNRSRDIKSLLRENREKFVCYPKVTKVTSHLF